MIRLHHINSLQQEFCWRDELRCLALESLRIRPHAVPTADGDLRARHRHRGTLSFPARLGTIALTGYNDLAEEQIPKAKRELLSLPGQNERSERDLRYRKRWHQYL